MKTILKRIMLTAGILILGLAAWGCTSKEDSPNDAESEQISQDGFYIYYVNDKWTDISKRSMEIDQYASPENTLDSVMKMMLEGGGTQDMVTPVPDGMVYQRYVYDGFGTVSLIFNTDFKTLDSRSAVLCKKAFVNTLVQIDTVDKVVFEMIDRSNDKNVITEELDLDSFADMDRIMNSESEVTIYMPDESGKSLVERVLTLDYSRKESIPEQIIEGLKLTYDGTVTPFNDKTVVRSVDLQDGICTVTFNDAFVKGKDGVDDMVLIYSIVDSLVGLDHIDGVQIQSENTGNRLNTIDLGRRFTGDYSYVSR